jgi:hypothetical protein
MGQYDGFEFEDENGEQLTGKALRDARDAAAKEARDLKQELKTLKDQLTERNLKDVLQEKALDPRLARFLKADGIDGSDAAKVDTWLSENGDLVGYQPKAPDVPGEADPRAEAFARMQNVQANALPAGQLTEAFAAVEKAESFADVNAALRRAANLG